MFIVWVVWNAYSQHYLSDVFATRASARKFVSGRSGLEIRKVYCDFAGKSRISNDKALPVTSFIFYPDVDAFETAYAVDNKGFSSPFIAGEAAINNTW